MVTNRHQMKGTLKEQNIRPLDDSHRPAQSCHYTESERGPMPPKSQSRLDEVGKVGKACHTN